MINPLLAENQRGECRSEGQDYADLSAGDQAATCNSGRKVGITCRSA
jgi:hypothetical protein